VSEPPLLVVATGNAGKLGELRALLAGLPLRVAGLAGLPPVAFPEEGDDYEANAIAKARSAAGALGHAALADDSGLEVEGLGGAPGPRSARYGGPGLRDAERVALLLGELAGRPEAARRARFVCVAALALPGGALRTARGSCAGRIAAGPRGAAGFGYDPVFEPQEPDLAGGRTLAELAPDEKARISHRARAVRALLPEIRRLLLAQAPQPSAAKRS
jgi:XTP/dITP diphosphohydrolase